MTYGPSYSGLATNCLHSRLPMRHHVNRSSVLWANKQESGTTSLQRAMGLPYVSGEAPQSTWGLTGGPQVRCPHTQLGDFQLFGLSVSSHLALRKLQSPSFSHCKDCQASWGDRATGRTILIITKNPILAEEEEEEKRKGN